jgi:hypothetical protein
MFFRAIGLFAAGLLISSIARSQVSDEYRVKAAFVYNFTKFVEWPSESFKSPQDPFYICILGKSPFGDALADVIHGKPVNGRPILIRIIAGEEEACTCHILFVGLSERKHSRSILTATSARAVLTVGEMDSFLAEGEIINLKFDDEKIRIQINLQAAKRQNLRISSKLSSLAEIIGGQ